MTGHSLLQMNTIFISLLIEALPFILLGVFVSGLIQIFVSEDMIARIMPKNQFSAVIVASLLGALYPSCECGIIPVARRLISKGVPVYAGIAFMLTGPIINPVTLFSTYVAFGNNWSMVLYRGGLALIVAPLAGFILTILYKGNPIKENVRLHEHTHDHLALKEKVWESLKHAVDEFFSVGKFLILGAFIAASVQTYVHTSTLVELGQGKASSSLVMMGMAYVLSLCSQADAFIAASFRSTFPIGSLVAFLVLGPMFDIKNTLMMLGTFKPKVVFILLVSVSIFVFLGSLFI
jgi:uncharacterized membrane protein YraQ (UPF0718 family)